MRKNIKYFCIALFKSVITMLIICLCVTAFIYFANIFISLMLKLVDYKKYVGSEETFGIASAILYACIVGGLGLLTNVNYNKLKDKK